MLHAIFSRGRAALLALVLATVGAFGVVAATPGSAFANANGCTYWGGLTIHVGDHNIGLPGGRQCINVVGSGTFVTGVQGWWNAGYMYDSLEVVRFYDTNGNNYRTDYGPTHWGYAYGQASFTETLNSYMRRGSVCTSAVSGGVTVATACEQIR